MLEKIFYSALAMLDERNYFVEARFKKYAGIKCSARVRDGKIIVRASDAFESAGESVLLGMAFFLLSRVLRKRLDEKQLALVAKFEEFQSRESVAKLHNTLRSIRGRKTRGESSGSHFDLNEIIERLFFEYPEVFRTLEKPLAVWSKQKSKRRLGWHDPAFDAVVINKALDSQRVPPFAIESVVFHELLHRKHDVLYQRGKSLRRTVHSPAFKADDAKYKFHDAAEMWFREGFHV